jgi:cystathionine beta-lyase
MHLSHILNHLGEDRENYFNAVAPPIIQTSNFAFKNLEDFRGAFVDELQAHLYSRGNNPTVEILRKKIAALEEAEDSLVFSSGAGAIANAVIANVKAGDHIVCVQSSYSWTYSLISNFLARFGVQHTFVDGSKTEEIEAAVQPNTTVLYLESPNSVTLELQDLEACVALAKKYNLTSIIDSTYSSPLYQKPCKIGIDISVHTCSKYLNGHSDVIGGVISSSKAMIKKIFESEYMTLGGIISPNDAAMIIRGLRTLEIRLERTSSSALKIAKWLEAHPKIEKVIHPHLPTYPQYELAKKQMKKCGGLFSIYLKTDSIEKVEDFHRRIERFLLAVSWGGHESLLLPFCAFYGIPGRPDTTIPWNLVRIYVGLEDPDWLIEDLAQALEVL